MKKKKIQTLYLLMQVAIWGIYGVLFSYANRYLMVGAGLSDAAAGLLLAAATGVSFLLQPLLTAVADRTRVSCRRIVLLSGCVMALSCLLLLLPMPSVVRVSLFILACVALQILPSFSNALAMGASADGAPLNFGLCRGSGSVAFGLFAQLGNLLISAFGLFTVPLCTLALCLLLLLSAAFFPESRAETTRERAPSSAGAFFRANPAFAAFLLGTVLLYVGHNVLSNCMYRIAILKGNEDAQGTALLIAAAVELPVMFSFSALLRLARCERWLRLSAVFFTVRLALTLLLPGVTGLYAAQLAQMGGFALFAVSSVCYAAEHIEKRDVVKGQTYLGASNTLGCVLAYALGGVLIGALGTAAMLAVCVVLSAVGTVLVLCAVRR